MSGEAFGLIERYRTPPDPKVYAVWYNYVSGADVEVVRRVDEVTANPELQNAGELHEIYNTCIDTAALNDASIDIGLQVEDNLNSITALVESGVQNNKAFERALGDAEANVKEINSPQEMKMALQNLIVENEKMIKVTQTLNDGLAASKEQISKLNRELDEVQSQSLKDPLTNVANRRAFDKALKREIKLAMEAGTPLSLALVDIDFFKRVNDTLGHQTGDDVLIKFAQILHGNVKGQDLVSRYGGEEFAIILSESRLFSAHNLMVKIKKIVEEMEFFSADGAARVGRLTSSFGVAEYQAGEDADAFVMRADMQLYKAKSEGRNRVCSDGF
ncbi:MAG: GGDEF domain-containing protein [Pseudomonadota bacterium]